MPDAALRTLPRRNFAGAVSGVKARLATCDTMNSHTHDLIIIGAGPAGLSAAIQAKRLGLDLTVLERDRPGGQALAAYAIENYPGCAFGVSGKQLMQKFIDHADTLGIDILKREATAVEYRKEAFCIHIDGDTMTSRSVIVATGLKPKALRIRGASRFEGTRCFCYVDPERIDHRDKRILVIGSGDAAFDQALNFADRAASVTIAMRGAMPRCLFLLNRRAERRHIKILRSATPLSMRENQDGVRVTFTPTGNATKGRRWDVLTDYVIACIGKTADPGLLLPLMKGSGRLPLEPGAVAKWPGLYLAGDLCRGNQRQISIATGDGMRAAMDAYSYLIGRSSHEHPFVHR